MEQILVTRAKLESADHLYRQCPGWLLVDSTLDHMRVHNPGNIEPSVVAAKVRVINTLYYTNLLATNQMAHHIVRKLEDVSIEGPRLVNAISELKVGGKVRHFRSFASKYCHFFVSPEEYPILDRYNTDALGEHLGEPRYRAAALREDYTLHYEAMQQLVRRNSLEVSWRGLDHYLYLWALWRAYCDQQKRERIAEEVRGLFDRRQHVKGIRDAIRILVND